MPTASELPIDNSASATQMADAMFGSGVQVLGASYTGHAMSSGIYSDGDSVAPDAIPSDSGVILSTGYTSDFTNADGDVNADANTTGQMDRDGDDDLSEIAGGDTYDAAVFEASFIPDGDTLTMQIVFSSEEYLEYVDSGYNDAVGIWVNGEKATLSVGDGDVTVDNINDEDNANLYIDNPADGETVNSEMDGLTITLTVKAPVNPGEVNTIKIGIADAGDDKYDSNLLIAGDSIQCALVAQDDEYEIGANATKTVDVLANDAAPDGATMTITKINGQEVSAGDSVTLNTGEVVTLNPDGTLSIQTDGDLGSEAFTYEVEDSDGNTDTGFVKVTTTTAPCFVAGTEIVTQSGLKKVEALMPGDMVLTRDNGFQPLLWIGTTMRQATGSDAPIRLAKDALGNHEAVEFSPNHRILIKSSLAAMLFGESEVLVKAKDLVNGDTITVREDHRPVTYVHILFDRHEIVRANGLDSESYHPGQETLDSFDAETRDEILRLMPNSDALMGYGFGPSARVSLRKYEAEALMAAA
ncbi:MAG: choice-of-anchor L domain-containing protein [Shimia sp.]|uniref:choice-of-anchor L domain-containing protein n=1 Tax=Shimia sp. TaxID=1954381 RepID=UPI0025F456F5|nr:choice-of-anchor L domain-containing protein [Shimia sp.]MCH2067038.1 choice-of-anchor L domain-containing protein [Shimia sp.]